LPLSPSRSHLCFLFVMLALACFCLSLVVVQCCFWILHGTHTHIYTISTHSHSPTLANLQCNCLFAKTISIWRQITGSTGSRYECQCPGKAKRRSGGERTNTGKTCVSRLRLNRNRGLTLMGLHGIAVLYFDFKMI